MEAGLPITKYLQSHCPSTMYQQPPQQLAYRPDDRQQPYQPQPQWTVAPVPQQAVEPALQQ
ncbi:hypothetical protein HDU98_007088, partial [Podochytrium sp. JEL0797]